MIQGASDRSGPLSELKASMVPVAVALLFAVAMAFGAWYEPDRGERQAQIRPTPAVDVLEWNAPTYVETREPNDVDPMTLVRVLDHREARSVPVTDVGRMAALARAVATK